MKQPLRTPCLMLVTEPHANLPKIVGEAVSGGVNAVQWRDNVTPESVQRQQSEAMRSAVLFPNVLVVNGSLAMMVTAQADGLHLPEGLLVAQEDGFLTTMDGLVGYSVHSVESARKAAALGADYVVVGTIYASQSHPGIAPQGLRIVTEVASTVDIPTIAIGGITPENLAACINAGASGVAVLSPIMRAIDPRKTAQEYRDALDGAWSERR